MIMLVDISKSSMEFGELSERLDQSGKTLGVSIRIQHEDIFHSMHRI